MAVLLTAAAATNRAAALYILTGADDAAIVLDDKATVPDLSSQMVFVTTGGKGYDVTLAAGQTVTVRRNGETQTVKSRKESISRLLERMDIVPSPLETVAVNLAGPGVEITVEEEIIYYDRIVEQVTFDTVRVANPEMKKGFLLRWSLGAYPSSRRSRRSRRAPRRSSRPLAASLTS